MGCFVLSAETFQDCIETGVHRTLQILSQAQKWVCLPEILLRGIPLPVSDLRRVLIVLNDVGTSCEMLGTHVLGLKEFQRTSEHFFQ